MSQRDMRQARIDAMADMRDLDVTAITASEKDSLDRQRAGLPPSPPLPPEDRRGNGPSVEPDGDIKFRVTRLEAGFCAAFVLIFTALIGSYLLLASKIDAGRDSVAGLNITAAEIRGDIRVQNEKAGAVDRKLDKIADKVGAN